MTICIEKCTAKRRSRYVRKFNLFYGLQLNYGNLLGSPAAGLEALSGENIIDSLGERCHSSFPQCGGQHLPRYISVGQKNSCTSTKLTQAL